MTTLEEKRRYNNWRHEFHKFLEVIFTKYNVGIAALMTDEEIEKINAITMSKPRKPRVKRP